MWDSMGYGDVKCPECGHVEYAESEEDFESRIADRQLSNN